MAAKSSNNFELDPVSSPSEILQKAKSFCVYIHGVVLSSIGSIALYGSQIRGNFVLLTVILRLLKFVRELRKNALC